MHRLHQPLVVGISPIGMVAVGIGAYADDLALGSDDEARILVRTGAEQALRAGRDIEAIGRGEAGLVVELAPVDRIVEFGIVEVRVIDIVLVLPG